MTPLVSIIVPTRDHADLVDMAHRTIARAGWSRAEAIFVDNGTTDAAALHYLARSPHRVLRAPIPFNFARLANRGASVARGDVLVLLNNDVEALADGWLRSLVQPLLDDALLGVVGCVLRYPSGRVQHAGISMEGGVPHHEYIGYATDDLPAGLREGTRECDAVTAACMAVRADLWRGLGGMSSALATNYNDVDLCLRARAAGWRVACTGRVALVHHESESRGRWPTADVAADWLLFRSRWPVRPAGDQSPVASPAAG